MKINKLFTFFAVYLLSLTFCYAQSNNKTPEGLVINEATCPTTDCPQNFTYFFADGKVIYVTAGRDGWYVMLGNWKMKLKEVEIIYTKSYSINRDNTVDEDYDDNKWLDGTFIASIEIIEEYSKVSYEGWTKEVSWEEADEMLEADETYNYVLRSISVHGYKTSDVHQFLRTGFIGKYPFTSERLLTESEIEKYDLFELTIMRNEIFARYGHIFKTQGMKSYFENEESYISRIVDATPFLSNIELRNIEIIKKREKILKQ